VSATDAKFVLSELGGTDERWQTAPKAARRIRDMTWDAKGGWKTCGGYGLIFASGTWSGIGNIDSLHWYSDHGGARQFLIFEANSRWYRAVGSGTRAPDIIPGKGGTAVDLHSIPATPHVRTQSISIGGFLYLLNGLDSPMVYNGRYMQRAGFEAPPPPPTAVWLQDASYSADDRGIGPNPAEDTEKWARRYRYSHVNERGQEGPLSEPSSVVEGTNENNSKTGAGLTFSRGGAGVVARRIYATHNLLDSEGELLLSGEAQNYYFLAEIQDNIQTTFEDVTPDAYIQAVVDPDQFGEWPSGAQFIETFGGTTFLAGRASNSVWFSAPGTVEVFPPLNRISVGDDESGEFTGFYPTKGALVVFKRNGIYLIKGDPVNGFQAITLTKTTGCIAPDSAAEIPNMGLMFLGNEGPMLMEGALENTGTPTRVIPVWTPVPDMVGRINMGAAVQAQGAINTNDREYWLSVPWDGSERNNTVMVYHYEIGAWSYRETMPVGCMVVTADHRSQLFFGSNNSAASEGVYAYSHGQADKDGTAIAPMYETTDLDFGDRFTAVVPETVTLWAIGYGNQDARLGYTVNRHYKRAYAAGTLDDAEDQQDTTNEYNVLGSVSWGASVWYNLRPVPVTFSVYTKDGPPVREFRFEASCDGRMFQLVGAEILASVTMSDKKTEPLHIDLVVDRK
jgi:hypothetical protein